MTLVRRLRYDLLSARFPRAVLASWTLTTIIVLYCFAVAGIVFDGALHSFATEGAGMLLFGATVFCPIVGLCSRYRGALAAPQDVSAAMRGTMAATVAAGTAHTPVPTAFMTMTALLPAQGLPAVQSDAECAPYPNAKPERLLRRAPRNRSRQPTSTSCVEYRSRGAAAGLCVG